ALGHSLGWEVGGIWTVDPSANVLRCLEIWHSPLASHPEWEWQTRRFTFAPGVGMPGQVWGTGEAVWIPDVTRDANLLRAALAVQEGLHAAFAFPILLDEQLLGVVEFLSPRFREPEQDLREVFAGVGRQLGQFLERKQVEDQFRQAQHRLRHVLA